MGAWRRQNNKYNIILSRVHRPADKKNCGYYGDDVWLLMLLHVGGVALLP
jgi:hypothetical protein